jgi:hypothetical protein
MGSDVAMACCNYLPARPRRRCQPCPAGGLRPGVQVLDGWSSLGMRQRLDKRKLQAELDTHRLFLLTSHYAHVTSGAQRSCCAPASCCPDGSDRLRVLAAAPGERLSAALKGP